MALGRSTVRQWSFSHEAGLKVSANLADVFPATYDNLFSIYVTSPQAQPCVQFSFWTAGRTLVI